MPVSFVKTGNTYTPVSFGRGRTLDSGGSYEPKQITTETGSGNVQICDIGTSTRFITCNIENITPTVYNRLVNFLKDDTVRWRGFTFDFRDEDYSTAGDEIEVRYWGEVLEEIPMKSGNVNIQIPLRVE